MHFSKAWILSGLTGLTLGANVCQHHQNSSPTPSGNPIHKPERGQKVPVGKSFDIEWTASSQDKISIVLLRGPRDNAEEFQCLADSIDNTGHFAWTPSEDLQPDQSNYGLKIIVDSTGDYQYSDLFGIKNPQENHKSKTKSEEASHTKEHTKEHTKTDAPHTKHTGDHSSHPEHTKTKHETHTGTKSCDEEPCHHKPTSKAEHVEEHKEKAQEKAEKKAKKLAEGHASGKELKYHNSTVPHPTGHRSKSKTVSVTHSKSKHHRPTHTVTPGASTSVALVTNVPSTSGEGQVTSVAVASAPGGPGATEATVTTGTSSPTTTPELSNGATSLQVTGALLAGVLMVVAYFLL